MSPTPEEPARPSRWRARSGAARRGRFTQRALAAVRHCFACSSYFPEVLQNCAPVKTNGGVNTSTPLARQTFCGKAASLTRAGALDLSFRGPKQTLSVSISARHPSASCRSLPTSERRVTASGASPFIFVRQAAAWQFASDCFPFSPQ